MSRGWYITTLQTGLDDLRLDELLSPLFFELLRAGRFWIFRIWSLKPTTPASIDGLFAFAFALAIGGHATLAIYLFSLFVLALALAIGGLATLAILALGRPWWW